MINKIELSDEQKEKIVTLTEKSLENNDTVINLRLTKQKVYEIRKCGISIAYRGFYKKLNMNCSRGEKL